MKGSLKQRYISSAFLLMTATVVVKVIGAVYKIPLTSYIGAVGRGYFSTAYNLCLPIHALTMGAFPLALTKLVSSYDAKGDNLKIKALRYASKKLFVIIGLAGLLIMLLAAKPYSALVSDSNGAVYTILALAPSVFFSCLCACNRAFCEGYMDMKCTSISQIIEAVIKTVFGLLAAKMSMGILLNEYFEKGAVLGVKMLSEEEALYTIYPITSAAAMLGVTFGNIISWIFTQIYTAGRYNSFIDEKADVHEAFSELVMFSFGLVGATAVQSVSAFFDNFSIQYCLSAYQPDVLSKIFNTASSAASTYAYGIYSAVLDFKNLVPSIVMSLGVAAVPAVSSAFESSDQRFSYLLTSIFKYSSLLSVTGGVFISLFSNELLSLFYASSQDIVDNGHHLMFISGVTILPCCLASTAVFCTQALGYSKQTILPFAVSAVIRVAMNVLLVPVKEINLAGAFLSNFAGYFVIAIWNIITIIKKTHSKLSFSEIIFKPIVVAALSYFTVKTLRESFFTSMTGIVDFCLLALLFAAIHIFYMLTFKCLSLKDIKIHK